MKFLFLVTSSIKHFNETHLSAYTEEERFGQTLETINSIREKVPDSYVVLIECSFTRLNDFYRKILTKFSDLFLEFHDEPGIVQIYENLKSRNDLLVYGKSLLETRGLLNALSYIKEHNYFNDSQRVFKITGRYVLNNNFSILDYKSRLLENKYVIKKYEYLNSDFEVFHPTELGNIYAALYGAKGMMITGLWSFDKLLFNEVYTSLEKSFIYMEKMIQYTSGIDIEHSLYRFINLKNVIDTSTLGLTVIKGMVGDNGGIYEV